VIGRRFFSKSDEFGPFFSWKILPIGRNHIFQDENSPVKETLPTTAKCAKMLGQNIRGCHYNNFRLCSLGNYENIS
jgi:hypothetical protein